MTLRCKQDPDAIGVPCNELATYYVAKNVLGPEAHFLCAKHALWCIEETGLQVIQLPKVEETP